MDRRSFLKTGALVGASLPMFTFSCSDTDFEPLPTYQYDGPLGPPRTFSHGVASGDPTTDAVIIWTRVTPSDLGPVQVFWEMAKDQDFENRVAADWAEARQSGDWTLKVDVMGLEPGETYYYRFFALGRQSLIGRTRTIPLEADEVALAVTSCSNMARGFFRAYRKIAERDDIFGVLHLGDYIYEYGGGTGATPERDPFPRYDIVSLNDYRTRYAQYRSDRDLQAVHQNHPFIAVWDDHETANNSWKDGADNHSEEQGLWADRKAAGIRAYFEWLPIREREPGRIWRQFQFGDLVDLLMLDTRLWGREQAPPFATPGEVAREERQLLGEDQEEWLLDNLTQSNAVWKVLGQQVMMAHFRLGLPPSEVFINGDQWDGYSRVRERLLNHIETNSIEDVVVLTGDIHTSWANELTIEPVDPEIYNPETSAGARAVEFVTPAISSQGLESLPPTLVERLQSLNPHIRWVEATKNGYYQIKFSRDSCEAEFWHLDDVFDPRSEIQSARRLRVDRGESKIRDITEV